MKSKPIRLLQTLTLVAALAFGSATQAASITKAATGTDLNDGASWGGTAPGSADIATWSSTSLGSGLTVGADTHWLGLSISGAQTDVDISGGGVLTLGASGIDMSTSAVNLVISNPITLGGNQPWYLKSGQTLTSSGVVSGGFGLTLGAGVPVISSATYSAAFLPASPATVAVFPGVSLASVTGVSGMVGGLAIPTTTGQPGTVYFYSNNGTTATFQLQIADSGYTKGVKVQLTQVGADIHGTVLYAKYYLGANGSNFDTTGTSVGVSSGPGVYYYGCAGLTINYNTTVASAGTFVLSGANTYTGPTTVSAGTLKAGVTSVPGISGALGNNSAVTMANAAAVLDLNGFSTQIGSLTGGGGLGGNVTNSSGTPATLTIGGDNTTPAAYAGVIGGNLELAKTGTGTLTLSSANTYSGGTTVNGGTISLGNNASLGAGTVTLNGGGISRNVAAASLANAVSIGAGGGTISGRTSNFDNYVFLAGPVTGSGALTLKGLVSIDNASNGYNGVITIANAGSLSIGSAGSSELYLSKANSLPGNPSVNLSDTGSGMRLDAAQVIDQLSGSGRVRGTAGLTIGAAGGSSTFGGTLVQSGGLTKTGSGTITLTNNSNTYAGGTTINDGSLLVDNTTGSGTGTGVVAVSGTGTLGGSGRISGAVTVNSGGTLSGTVTLNAGTTVNSGGTLTPGGASIGTLTVNNTLTLQSGSTTTCQINKTSADPVPLTHDQLFVNAVTYGGTLEVTATGDTLAVGDSFRLFDSLSYGGSFTTYALPALTAGLSWDVSGLVVDGTITVVNTLNTPVINPPAGPYAGSQAVSITSNTGSTIHYTLDGSDPHTSGTRISSPSPATGIILSAPSTPTIRAYAQMAGFADSAETSASYTILTAATWITDGDGNWSDSLNWQAGAIAYGSGVTADFSTLDLSADTIVTLDGSRTIGKLIFGDNTTPDSNWTVAWSGGTELTLDAAVPTIEVVNQAATLTGVIVGANGLTKTGAGLLTLNGTSIYTGGTIISGGTVKLGTVTSMVATPLGAPNYAATSVAVQSGATLDLNGAAASGEGVRHGVTLNGTGTAGQGALVNNGPNGSFGIISTPNIALAADATIGGTGNIFMISPAYAANNLSLNGHTLTKTGSNTFWLGTTTADSGTIFIAQGTVSQNQNAGINNLGSVAISIADAAGATLALNTKSLTIGSLTGGGTTGGGVNLGANTLTVGADNTSPAAFAGAISGTGSIIKTGTGTLTLSGSNTYTGNTTANDGTLHLAAGGSLKFVIGATSGTNNSISGSGTVTLDGAFGIDTTLADATALTTGTWVLENVPSLTGAYGSSFAVTGFTNAGSDKWTKSVGAKLYTFDETTGTLTLSPSGFSGWADANGVTGGPSGDSDNDGIKNLVEYALNLNFAGSDGSSGTFSGNVLTFTKRAEAIANADVTYVIETSPDLTTWTPVVTHAPGNTDPTITYSLPAGAGKLFSRLNVTIP